MNPDRLFIIPPSPTNRFLRANVVIAVLFSPVEGTKIPEWEMMLSAGAVCQNLLVAAQSFNYAAQWLTEWYAYNIYNDRKIRRKSKKR